MKRIIVAALATVLVASASQAKTIDFTALANNTAVNTQFAGVSFSLVGGADSSGSPLASNIWNDGGTIELNNSNSGSYPTSNAINVAFATATSNVSFLFNNYGNNDLSFYTAYDALHNVVSTGSLSGFDENYFTVSVAGNGIRDLLISNGEDDSRSWEFGIQQLNFAGGVPEPTTWALMLVGFGAVGVAVRRRQTAVAA